MAFPIPEHLPRRAVPQDISTKILTKVSEVSSKELTASLAASWISELDKTILQTKERIHERIHSDLPAFERQLASSKSVQTRLLDLTVNVDKLSDSLSNPETGLLPNLLSLLKSHSSLAQEYSDTAILHEALEYLSRCKDEIEKLHGLVHQGNLTHATKQGMTLQDLVNEAPEALSTAEIMVDMKRQLRALIDHTQEQLSEAYSRSVVASPTELRICPSVQVRQSECTISFSDILSSLSTDSLNSHLMTLRRDLVSRYIYLPLQGPMSSSVAPSRDSNGTPSQTFSLFPFPPHADSYSSTIGYLRSLFGFLDSNFFSFLPLSVRESFPRSLCRATVTAILREVLVPHLPSSLTALPPFLALVDDARQFEQDYIIGILKDDERGEREIKTWADNVPSHYGRKRRTELLGTARTLIISVSAEKDQTFRVELSQSSQGTQPEVIAVQGDDNVAEENGWNLDGEAEDVDDGWGFNESVKPEPPVQIQRRTSEGKDIDNESGWDFDDDAVTAVEDLPPENPTAATKPNVDQPSANGNRNANDVEEDPSDAWGWDEPADEGQTLGSENANDTAAFSSGGVNGDKYKEPQAVPLKENSNPSNDSGESAWDDPWADPAPAEPQAPLTPPSPVRPVSPPKQPKLAKRLEKFSKGKRAHSPSYTSSNPASPALASPAFPSSYPSPSSMALHSPRPSSSFPTPSSATFRSSQLAEPPQPSKPPNPPLKLKPKERETFSVTNRAKDIVDSVKSIISEGQDILRSSVFSHSSSGKDKNAHSSPSSLVFQTAPSVLDLYRALYPITFSSALEKPKRSMQFSNDCLFIGDEAEKLSLPKDAPPSLREQMHESAEKMKSLGDWWFDESIERVRTSVLNVLKRAEGFTDTGDQERFDECESVMSEVLRSIRSSASDWEIVLPPTKYYRATGAVVEAALTLILTDVLALRDIPEVDSHRLSELCRILNALEGLFADGTVSASVVVEYVPSWLKYSYLSELLEASIADISYLFDEGTLIDFEVDELVKLVKALFADTPLRTNTIAKLQRGHPSSAS